MTMVHDPEPRDVEKAANKPARIGNLKLNSNTITLADPELKEEEEKQERHESRRVSSASSMTTVQDDIEQGQVRDVEALSTVQSNSPPYSVFSKRKKQLIVLLAAWGGFFSPLSANIYFPALTSLTRDFNVSSTLMNLTLTSYMIFQGLAPTIFGDLADMA